MLKQLDRVVQVRSVFLSDIHLGTRDCKAELLLDFLAHVQPAQLILVGDIIDLQSLKRTHYWPDSHTEVIRRILRLAVTGTRVILVPGNHDAALRSFCGLGFGAVELHQQYVHRTARGLKLLVLHGDEFDGAVHCSRWLSGLGSAAYDALLGLNRLYNAWRGCIGRPYWSLAGYIKERVGNARQYVDQFEKAALHAARRQQMDGVICGHIHRAELAKREGLLYCNDGDWVDSCTALVEDRSGELTLWHWDESRLALMGREAA